VKKSYLIFLIVIVIIAGAWLSIRFLFLKTKDVKPDNSKAASVLDLRPAIIAKLQQLVKDGSGGLYHLSIEQVEPDISSLGLDIMNGALIPDTAVLKNLDSAHKLPDDIFKLSFSTLHISGVGIDDLLSKDHLSLRQISIASPVIEVWHKKRRYNKGSKNDSATLYQRLFKSMKSIVVDEVAVSNAGFILHDFSKNQTNRFNNVSLSMRDVLIDSSTQADKKRYLFAKHADLTVKNFSAYSADSLYSFKCSSIHISPTEDRLTALNIEMHPDKQQFKRRFSERKERYELVVPKLRLSGIGWWELINERTLIAKEAVMEKGRCHVFIDRSLPFRKVRPDNFPHQQLMRLPVSFFISRLHMRNSNLTYSEYNPGMDKTGAIYVSNVSGELMNATNIPARIKLRKMMSIRSSGLFMHKVPMTMSFQFDLSKYKTGDFRVDLIIGKMDSSVLNPMAVPMGEFMIKEGQIQQGIAHVSGNNFKTHGQGKLLYSGLYLVALKKDEDKEGGTKKKKLLSRLANVILIKNENPSNDEPVREVDFYFDREAKLTFFSFIWKTIYIGILKLIGLPQSFADKSY